MKKGKAMSLFEFRGGPWWIVLIKVSVFILAVCILVPFFWMLTSAVKTTEEYMTTPIVWFSETPQWQNFSHVLIEYKFIKYIFNSLFLAISVVMLSVIASAYVAFGFSRFNFHGKRLWFAILLSTMMLPAQVTIIPQFLLFKEIGWTRTFLPMTIPQLCGAAGSILLIYQFMKGVPKTIDEAAKIDGASNFGVFFRIMLPQVVPILIVVALFTFLGSWKDSFGPLIYLRSENLKTVPLALMEYISPSDPNRGILFSGLTIALIPTILVYIFGQKYIENGVVIPDLK